MEKSKLLTVALFCLCFAGIALAEEVINIDLNGQGDDVAYTGEAAIPGEDVWRAIYQGTGVAVGSARTSDLADYDEPNEASIYAAQVWLEIPEDDLFTKVADTDVYGNDLMDDGFVKSGVKDPCLYILSEPQDRTIPAGAYNGTYDIYVYGAVDGDIIMIRGNDAPITKPLTGGPFNGDFNEDDDYVVFEDVVIDDGNSVVPGDGNTVTIIWKNTINGLQLVKQQELIEIVPDTVIPAQLYDVARETNKRVGEPNPFGPDIVTDPCAHHCSCLVCNGGINVSYLDNSEYMIYDFNCSVNDGREYSLKASVLPDGNTNGASLLIYYYNDNLGQEIQVGEATLPAQSGGYSQPTETSSTVEFNIFPGEGYLRWKVGSEMYFNLFQIKLSWTGNPVQMGNCADVYFYKYNYLSDYDNDCDVDEDDLLKIVDNWVTCYDPNTANCP